MDYLKFSNDLRVTGRFFLFTSSFNDRIGHIKFHATSAVLKFPTFSELATNPEYSDIINTRMTNEGFPMFSEFHYEFCNTRIFSKGLQDFLHTGFSLA